MRFLKDHRAIIILFILTLALMPFDSFVMNELRYFKEQQTVLNNIFSLLMPVATFLGHGSVILIIGILALAVGKTLKNTGLLFAGKYIVIGFLVSGIGVQLLKHLFGRARPRLTEEILFIGPGFVSGFDSFPSGHTAVVFCLACLFAYAYKNAGACLFVFALITGLERVYNMSHFPSDVSAGAITGIIAAAMIRSKTSFLADYKSHKRLEDSID